MIIIWKEITVSTQARTQLLDITAAVEREVVASGITNGVCYLYVPHTTAGITINENSDPDVVRDLIASLARLVPESGPYLHQEGNSDAHLKASLMGFSCLVPVSGGHLALGTWQAVYFCEFDGPRRRKLKIDVMENRE